MPASAVRRRLASVELPAAVRVGMGPGEPRRRLATGVEAWDAVAGGGLLRGGVTELAGPGSSGRTALAWVWVAAATRRGEPVAVVDLPDALHPASLAAAGADLARVLWVRPPSFVASLQCAELLLGAGGFAVVVLDLGAGRLPACPGHVWPRLQRRAREAGSALAVLAPRRLAGSFAHASFALRRQRTHWSPPPWRLFDGLTVEARSLRGPRTSTPLTITSHQ